jgi:magnesium transporter
LTQQKIDVLGSTASSYTTGKHWAFCQTRANPGLQPWRRPGRQASFQPVTIEHLMASSAIPFLFPAVPLLVNGHKKYFGDGSISQLSPLSPAIHFGARRLLVIGVSAATACRHGRSQPRRTDSSTIAGHAMATVFHDTLQADMEQTQRVIQTLAKLPPELAAAFAYHPVDVLALQPSFSLDELAHKHIKSLPASTRNTLTGLGALEERRWVKQHFGLSIPKNAMDDGTEKSARFFEEDYSELHVRSDFLIDDLDNPHAIRVAFILNKHNDTLKSQGVLFSLREKDTPVFRLLRMPGLIDDAKDVRLMLFDADDGYCADTLQDICDNLETVSRQVLAGDMIDNKAAQVLSAMARHKDMWGRIRRNVMGTQRAASFMVRSRLLNAEQFEDARQILCDLDSLNSHTALLFDKINFLMDATVGFININQKKIIKIFSVVSVALLAPTLIASAYGMNFKFMPELDWQASDPFSIALMVLSAVGPMLYFRKRGWLR